MKVYVITTRCFSKDKYFDRLEETDVAFDEETAKEKFMRQYGLAHGWLYDVDYELDPYQNNPDENTCCIVAGNRRSREKYLCLITLREVEVQ